MIDQFLSGRWFWSLILYIYSLEQLQYACTAVAIILHYALLAAFGWMFVEGVHLYRMMTEIRDINTGPMTYSYVLSYGLSALIVGLAVPLSNINYGSQVNSRNEHL